MPKWTADRSPVDLASVDLTYWLDVLPITDEWAIQSQPVAYQSGVGTVLVIYEDEGVVLFQSSTMQ